MRIAYDAASLLNPRTGIGHYTASLLEALLALDGDLQFSLFAITRQRNTENIPQHERVQFRHFRVPARVAVTAWEHSHLGSGERILGDCDVVHGTNFWVPPLSGKKGIVTIHDLTFWFYPELCTPQVRRYRWIVPKVLQRCAAMIVPSETIRGQAGAELGFPEDRIVVTPEGVRNAFTGASPDAALADRLGIVSDYLLFVGTQEPRKNLDRLIAAFARLDMELQLVIAGPAGWGSVDLPGVVRKLGLEGRVVFSGYLPDEEIGALMAGARAFVFPTLYEGFGLPPLEAMAAGVPVVAATAGSLPEVLGEGPFWCDPVDVDSIADALTRVVTDEDARATAVEAGRKRAASYDWSTTAELTLEAYRRVADA
jgi:glycosyltransferase involved in cell wall biosynthesis